MFEKIREAYRNGREARYIQIGMEVIRDPCDSLKFYEMAEELERPNPRHISELRARWEEKALKMEGKLDKIQKKPRGIFERISYNLGYIEAGRG